MKAQMGIRSIALLFLKPPLTATLDGVVNTTPRPLYRRKREAVTIAKEAGWAPGSVWTGGVNLAPSGFDPGTLQPVVSPYTD